MTIPFFLNMGGSFPSILVMGLSPPLHLKICFTLDQLFSYNIVHHKILYFSTLKTVYTKKVSILTSKFFCAKRKKSIYLGDSGILVNRYDDPLIVDTSDVKIPS
jgi:hypothetical protein